MNRVTIAMAVVAGSVAALAQAPTSSCPTPAPSEGKPWLNTSYTPQCRAQYVLAQLRTLDDKFAFLESGGGGRGRGNQRDVMAELGLVRGGGSDGPAGVRGRPTVTAFPTPLSVAANFDPSMASRFGDLLGQEFLMPV